MAFHLHPALPPTQEIARVAEETLTEACEAVNDSSVELAERIHVIRTASKKGRALLRLSPSWPQAAVKRADVLLRRAARRLAPFRDAEALLIASRALQPTRRADRDAVTALQRELAHHRQTLLADTPRITSALLRAARDYRQVRTALKRWPGGEDEPERILPAFQRCYRRARRRFRSLDREASGAAYHRWRKAVKRFGYHCRLLRCLWPPLALPYSEAVDQLGDLLGREHDLALLCDHVRGRDQRAPPADTDQRVLGLTDHRRHAIRRESEALARYIFAEKPKAYAHRLHEWWTAART